MPKKKITDNVIVSAQLQVRISRSGKLTDKQYSTIGRFQEAMPPLIREVEKKTALTFLELLQEFADHERKGKKAVKVKPKKKAVKK